MLITIPSLIQRINIIIKYSFLETQKVLEKNLPHITSRTAVSAKD